MYRTEQRKTMLGDDEGKKMQPTRLKAEGTFRKKDKKPKRKNAKKSERGFTPLKIIACINALAAFKCWWYVKMNYETFWQSVLANLGLAGLYLLYKLFSRVSRSQCHYTRSDGLEFHLPDAEERVPVNDINSFFEQRGLSMRVRQTA